MGYDKPIFLDQPLNNALTCPICMDVCEDAVTACESGHVFCAPCLARPVGGGDPNDDGLSNNETCPTCRSPRLITPIPNRTLNRVINELRVRCGEGRDDGVGAPAGKKVRRTETETTGDAATDGDGANGANNYCMWEGTLEQWRDDHTKVCPNALVRCPEKNFCIRRVLRKDLERHLKEECYSRKVSCDICNEMVRHYVLGWHENNNCQKAIVECEFCNEEMTREERGSGGFCAQENYSTIKNEKKNHTCTGHYATCPKFILHCEFSEHGCTHKFKREDADAHHAKNVQFHAALANQKLKRLEEDQNWDRVEMIWMIRQRMVAGSAKKLFESSVLTNASPCYDFNLGLHLGGPDDPVRVAICPKVKNCKPYYLQVRLRDILVRLTKDERVTALQYPMDLADNDWDLEKKEECIALTEKSAGGSGRVVSWTSEFSTILETSDGGDTDTRSALTRSKLLKKLDEPANKGRLMIRARFRIRRVATAYMM